MTNDALAADDRTSDRLQQLLHGNQDSSLSIGGMVAKLRNRALGMSMLIFAIPSCLPMPPGVSALSGIGVALVAFHLLIQRDQLWLPRFVGDRRIARADMERLIVKVSPHIERAEDYCRPRLMMLTSGFCKMLVGLVTLLLGLLLILPIPILGNLPPGIAAAVLAIGLSERDGVIVALGLLCSVIAIAVTSAAGWGMVLGLGRLIA